MKGGLDWISCPDSLDLGTDKIGGTRTHIIPINDDRKHRASMSCWCQPVASDWLPSQLLHNSADGREFYERGERKLN